jgi:NAD(P) transhydrogenase subunit alpha
MQSLKQVLITGLLLFGLSPPLQAIEAAPSGAEGLTAPPASDLTTLLFVFMLATFIGLGVITRVSRLLHTPLMSLTNAISAIAVVGAIVVTGANHPPLITFLGAVALFASTTNIVSGFLITDRMLKMFKRQGPSKP